MTLVSRMCAQVNSSGIHFCFYFSFGRFWWLSLGSADAIRVSVTTTIPPSVCYPFIRRDFQI